MALVTEYLVQLIAKQVDDKGWWSWYDPEQAYVRRAADLFPSEHDRDPIRRRFFRLRKQIDHLLNDGQPPRLVVYVPIERTETDSCLDRTRLRRGDHATSATTPGLQHQAVSAGSQFTDSDSGRDQVAEIERQVEASKLSLADLNSLADQGKDISSGVLMLIFGSANPQEVALAFLHSDQYDEEINKKEAEKELRHLLQVSFDIDFPAAEALSKWRVRLGRHVMLTDLFAVLKKKVPPSLSSVPVATGKAGIDACVRLAQTWRNSRDVRDSYVIVA